MNICRTNFGKVHYTILHANNQSSKPIHFSEFFHIVFFRCHGNKSSAWYIYLSFVEQLYVKLHANNILAKFKKWLLAKEMIFKTVSLYNPIEDTFPQGHRQFWPKGHRDLLDKGKYQITLSWARQYWRRFIIYLC